MSGLLGRKMGGFSFCVFYVYFYLLHLFRHLALKRWSGSGSGSFVGVLVFVVYFFPLCRVRLFLPFPIPFFFFSFFSTLFFPFSAMDGDDDLRHPSHPACFPINFSLDKKRIKEEEFGLVNYM